VYNMENFETCRPMIVRVTVHFANRALKFDKRHVLGLQLVMPISSLYKMFLHWFRFFGRPQESKRARNSLRSIDMHHPLCYSCSIWLFPFCRMALDVVSVTSFHAFQEVIRETFASPAASW
jgi:hypothetical protein